MTAIPSQLFHTAIKQAYDLADNCGNKDEAAKVKEHLQAAAVWFAAGVEANATFQSWYERLKDKI